MKTFQCYQEYKLSGIDWIDKIPSHWQSIKLKYLASINPTTNINVPNNIDLEFVPMENVDEKNGLIREYAFRPFEEIKNGYTPFQNDDVIFAKITPCMENGNCAIVQNLSNNIAFGSTEFIVFRSNELITKELLYYILRDKNTRKIFEINMTGSAGQKRVPTPFVANFKIPLPPLDEQKSIANFLDQKSKQIDEFIADKQALIILFEEQKSAIINDAVTKGLDKTIPFKPSGIEWIDEIPSHWETRKLKNICKMNYGDALETSQRIEGNVPVYGSNGIVGYHNQAITKSPCIIIGRKGSFGKINISTIPCFPIDTAFFIDDIDDSQYSFNWLIYLLMNAKLDELSKDTGVPGLNREDAYQKKYPVPPLEEQKQIVVYLETELAKIDTLIETAKAEITLIEEYKTSLINEAVTGKIKIHNGDAT